MPRNRQGLSVRAAGGRIMWKYRELTAKCQALVDRYAANVAARGSTMTLAMSALRGSRSGMALVREGRFLVRNQTWLAVERQRGDDWRSSDRAYPSLQALAIAEASAMLRAGLEVREVRFERGRPEQVLAVRIEQLQRPGTPLLLVVARDLTERVRGEREVARAGAVLVEKERMRAVGELASGLAHDLNNVLHAMSLRLQALQGEGDDSSRRDASVATLTRMVEDAACRVSRIQDLAHKRCDAASSDADLRTVIFEAVELARPELDRAPMNGRAVRVELEIPQLPRALGAGPELRHVLLGLVLNAREAMPVGGTIRIEGERCGDSVLLRVRDEGPGISEEALPRIFDPFFTTKGEKGTGLGLAIARSVVVRLGGRIRAWNAQGGGAVLELELPVSRLPAPPSAPADTAAVRGLRVLVVDDDPDVLEAARLVLENMGHRVDATSSGQDAIARASAEPRYDVVLCDLGMPDMNGWEVAEQLQRVAPGLRVYLVTGWANELAADDPHRALVTGILPKPLPLGRLEALLGTSPEPTIGQPPERRPVTPQVAHRL